MDIFEEISEPSRRHLLKELLDGAKNVSELVEATGLRQPNASNHLARLRARGLVRTSKNGRQVYYALASKTVEDALRSVLSNQQVEPAVVNLAEASKDYARAATRGAETECNRLVDRAIRAGHSLVAIYEEFLGPAMHSVGTWYAVEAIDEAQEHMASEITLRQMSRISGQFAPDRQTDKIAVVGCAPGNHHIIGLRMLADFLMHKGWQVKFLGANVPEASFVREVAESEPDLILISTNNEEGIEATLSLVRAIAKFKEGRLVPFVGVGGGAVVAELTAFAESGADFYSASLSSFANRELAEVERALAANVKLDWPSEEADHRLSR